MDPQAALRRLYAASGADDLVAAGALLAPDVFALPPAPDAAIDGRDAAVAALPGWQIRSIATSGAISASGRSAWVFDQVEAQPAQDGSAAPVPVRVTALLEDEAGAGWQVRAAHWSASTSSNAEQKELIAAGKLPPGAPLVEALTPGSAVPARRLRQALAGEVPLPELYSVGPDAVTIGSVTDEIFLGPAARDAWEQFMTLGPRFEERGGMRGGVTADGCAAWLAAHIDIAFTAVTPYRFFYIWRVEDGEWKIVVSHDSVT